jgi:hypothetical protein
MYGKVQQSTGGALGERQSTERVVLEHDGATREPGLEFHPQELISG